VPKLTAAWQTRDVVRGIRALSKAWLALVGGALALISIGWVLSRGFSSAPPVALDLSGLQQTDRIVIPRTGRTITDPATIQTVVQVTQGHSARWEVPWYGVPVGSVHVEFRQGASWVGDLGIGDRFVVTQWQGGFYSRPISAEDQALLLSALGFTPQGRNP
jgi:hypothetical protein